jgi:hypothetical protein
MEKCPNFKGNHITFSNRCAKKTEAARAARQSRKTELKGHTSMREVTGASRVALGSRQARGIRDDDGEPMANEEADDTREQEGAKGEGDLIMAETPGEIEIKIEMGAAASNDQSSPAKLCQVLCVDHGGAGDGSGTNKRFGNVAEAAGGKRRNWNQPFSIRD